MIQRLYSKYAYLNSKIKSRLHWELTELLFLLICIFSALMMILRCFFGTEFTDEAYTVSDALAVMHGNVPYAFNISSCSGMSFIPIIFYKIYEMIIPDLAGIFLYSRVVYVLFRLTIIMLIYFCLKDELERKWRLVLSGVLVPFQGGVIQNFSYNSIPTYLALLTSVLLYISLKKNNRMLVFIIYICGFLVALSVFAHPAYIFTVFVFGVMIILGSRSAMRLKHLLVYCIGGFTEIMIVFVPIISKVGIEKLRNGFDIMLTCSQEEYIKSSMGDRVRDIIYLGRPWWLLMVIIFVAMYELGVHYIVVDEIHLTKREAWMLACGITGAIMILASYLVKGENFYYVFGAVCLNIFFFMLPLFQPKSLAVYVAAYNVLFIVFMTLFTLTGWTRFYYTVPVLFCSLIVLFKSKNLLIRYVAIFICFLAIILQGYKNFKYVYRDDFISRLNTKVTEGVFKGIYTTPDRALDVVELEQYLTENIEDNESVCFRDNAPIAYLMVNKNVCDIRTWDDMQWSYSCDDPTAMYRYYQTKGGIPDVIAYIDFGRDQSMSIENPSSKFHYNNFVSEYYYLDESDFKNNTFRVLIYRNNGTFNYDWDRLLNWQ